MVFDVEIVLRERDYAVTEQIRHDGNEAARWNDADVAEVLRAILLAIDRVKHPAAAQRYVALRDFSWIVESAEGGVVIAIEIPSGAAVAGPFAISQPALDRMIRSVLTSAAPSHPSIH